MPLQDPSLHPVSACPVHFIWDGRGKGRAFVRAGFLGFTLAGAALLLGRMSHADVVTTAGAWTGGIAAASWGLGQVLSWFAARAFKRSLARAS